MHLGVHTLLNQFRRIFAVEPVELAVDERLEVFDGVFDLRGKQIVRHRTDRLAPVGNHVGIFDHDLICLFCAEIGKLFEHLVGRFEVDRKRLVRVGHLLCRQQDVAVNLVLGVEEVHVSGGNDGLSQLVAQLYNRAVEASEFFFILCHALFQHEAVVADGLDFKIVVKFRDALELCPALVVHDCLKQLSCLARRADDQALAPT